MTIPLILLELDRPRVLDRRSGGRVNHNPTPAQRSAGNYAKEHVNAFGFDIAIENKRGSKRRGISKDGKAWEVVMPADYGYFKRTEGSDSDHVDVYLGPHRASPKVFIIDQINTEDKSFDEHKVMLGFGSKTQALTIYRKGFSDGKGDQRIGSVKEMTIPQLKEWLKGDTTAPLKRGGIVPPIQPKKITRDAFLYLEPKDDQKDFAQCSSCYLVTNGKCLIHGPDIKITHDMTCAFYVPGEPQPEKAGQELRLVTPEQSGLVRGQVRCEHCQYTAGNTFEDQGCGLYRMLNQRQPEDFDLDPKIKSHGCCNAFIVAEKVS